MPTRPSWYSSTMHYRDERDALRGRVANLEEQLAAARKEIEAHRDEDREARVAEIERQMAEARRLLDQLGRELDDIRGRPKRSSAGPRVVLGLALVGGAAAWFSMHRSEPQVQVGIAHPAPVAAPVPPGVQTLPAPTPAAPPPSPPPSPPVPEPAPRTARATWKATVTRATGLPLRAGASCTIEAELSSKGDDIRVPELQVHCGGTPIYRSTDPLEGMSIFRTGVDEESGAAPGTYLYALSYEDKGTRAGSRAQISLDSTLKAGAVWRDTAPAYRVELALPYQSAPVTGEPLLDATSRAVRATARVTESTGPSPVKAGARCTLRASPLPRDGKCLTRFECGGRMLYGAGTTGVSDCTVDADRIVRIHDGDTTPHNGDPAFDLDLETGRVIVRDEVKGAPWTVGAQLDAR